MTKASASSGSYFSVVNGDNLAARTWGLVTGSGSAGVGYGDCVRATDSGSGAEANYVSLMSASSVSCVFVVSAGT